MSKYRNSMEFGFDWVSMTDMLGPNLRGTLLGTPNREPQECSRNIIGIYLPGPLYSIKFLLYSWGALFWGSE